MKPGSSLNLQKEESADIPFEMCDESPPQRQTRANTLYSSPGQKTQTNSINVGNKTNTKLSAPKSSQLSSRLQQLHKDKPQHKPF